MTGISRRGLLGCVGVVLLGCGREQPDVVVDLSKRGTERGAAEAGALRFAVGTMLAPRDGALDYQRLAAYLGSRTGRAVEVIQRQSYSETNALLQSGGADFAFICSGAFASLAPALPEILAVPVVDGKVTYASLIVVKQSDSAQDLADLIGGSFAYVDPLSLTGRIYPEWAVRKAAGRSSDLFSETTYTHSHSRSVDLVASGRVRAAGIDSLVFAHLQKTEPSRTSELRILHRSAEFGTPPIVAAPRSSPALRHILRHTLTQVHLDPEGRDVLAGLSFERFAPADPAAYDGILEMRRSVLGDDAGTGGGSTP